MKELLDVSCITIYRWITINLLGIKDSKTASMLVPNSVKDNEILLLKYTRKNVNKLLRPDSTSAFSRRNAKYFACFV
jgi:hypothetical protein